MLLQRLKGSLVSLKSQAGKQAGSTGSAQAARSMANAAAASPAGDVGLKSIEQLHFDNSTLQALPIDSYPNPTVQRTVRGANFSMVEPEPVTNPRVVCASEDALQLLDLDPKEVQRPDFADFFAGNKRIPGTQPAAHCYCGHQFGHFSGQLGDGAAMYLGEVVNSHGERWELQFKGAGLTPYSRAADGRKVLRSSLREFLCSEAIHALGIPTTRAGTCVTSDTKIIRDPLYDGNAIAEPATVITRIAQTFLRFGSFEIFKPTDSTTGRAGSSAGLEAEMLPTMLHFTIKNYFPKIWSEHKGDQLQDSHPVGNEPEWHKLYGAWFREVVRRTASMCAGWQSVGWCHGVLNTDNMSIVGLTIDYGPFGFMDAYNPDHVCNGSDDSGRYSYKNQPEMCRWNCMKLAEAVRWALPEKIAREELPVFDVEYDRAYMRLMRNKLGLLAVKDDFDDKLVEDLLKVMADSGADFTNTFRCLSRFPTPSTASSEGELTYADGGVLQYILGQCADVSHMISTRGPQMPPQNLQMMQMLMQRDPGLLFMMGLSPQMLTSELEKAKNVERLKSLTPEVKAESDRKAWSQWLQRYGHRLAKEAVAGADPHERVRVQNATNPRFVLRNWMAQEAIKAAEAGNYSEAQDLLRLVTDPFTTVGEDEVFARALAAGGAGTSHGQQAVAADAGAAVDPEAASVPPGHSALPANTPGSTDDYSATLAAKGQEGEACKLVKKYGDGKPPAWAAKLCVTCSS